MREDVCIRNFGDEPTFCSVEFFVDSDFADLFAVKEGRAGDPDGEITRDRQSDSLDSVIPTGHGESWRGVAVLDRLRLTSPTIS